MFAPAPDRPVPGRPAPLAREIETTTRALRESVDAWTGGGTPSSRAPRTLVLQAMYQQRIYRTMARDPALAGPTIDRLTGAQAREARANTDAAAHLFALVTPIDAPSRFRTGPAERADALLGYYLEAERRFGVDWEVLAALHHVESKFGRVRSTSTAGAQGPMQFLPSTWAAYGMGGDVHDDHDAILGAANYLRASGAPADYRRALFAYNHSGGYVEAVLLYAGQIMEDPRDYYAYYHWQVFVLTTSGDRRLTGPGL